MATSKRNIGEEILDALGEIKQGEYGRVTTIPSVASIREKTGLSQTRFAQLLGMSLRILQEWEQGRRVPSGAARTLPLIAEKKPRGSNAAVRFFVITLALKYYFRDQPV